MPGQPGWSSHESTSRRPIGHADAADTIQTHLCVVLLMDHARRRDCVVGGDQTDRRATLKERSAFCLAGQLRQLPKVSRDALYAGSPLPFLTAFLSLHWIPRF